MSGIPKIVVCEMGLECPQIYLVLGGNLLVIVCLTGREEKRAVRLGTIANETFIDFIFCMVGG